MADTLTSVLRIVLDPGGSKELMLLDWGDESEPFALPWEQESDREPFVESDFPGVYARGNVFREVTFKRRIPYSTHHALVVAQFDYDEALPINVELAAHIRIGDLPLPASSPAIGDPAETSATYAHYIAAGAVLKAVRQVPVIADGVLEQEITLQLGAIVKQP